jgi:hypothetical protein
MRHRTWTDEQLIEAVESCTTVAAVVSKLGLVNAGGSHALIQKHMLRLGLTCKLNARTRQLSGMKGRSDGVRCTDSEIFTETSTVSSVTVRKRYLALRDITYYCDLCKIDTWNNSRLTLQMDHINGNRRDHRLNNLRLLCPNCHSLTDTYGGKNRGCRKSDV